jgi:hypothetical protein
MKNRLIVVTLDKPVHFLAPDWADQRGGRREGTMRQCLFNYAEVFSVKQPRTGL